MPDGSKAYEIKVKAKIDGEERWVQSVEASIGVGLSDWPSVELVTHKPKDAYSKAEQLASTDVASEMGKRQKKMFSERSGPDVELSIEVPDDPDAGSFKFKGLLAGPNYAFGPYGVQQSDTCVPEYAAVECLSYSVYSPALEGLPTLAGDPNLQTAGTICSLIKEIQSKLRKDFSPDKKSQASDKQYAKAQHKINEKFAKFFEELLGASDSEEKFGWTKVTEALKKNDYNLKRVIGAVLLQSPGPFSGVISRLAEAFMCVYVPEWEKIGKLVNKYNLFKDTSDLDLVIVGMSVSATSGFGLLPAGFVGVNSPYLAPPGMPMESAKQFVVYPKENAEQGKGVMQQTMGPAWISPAMAVEEESPQDIEREQGVDVTKATSNVQTVHQKEKEAIKKNLSVMEEWGKSQYIHLALAKSQVTVYTTLTFKPEVGKFYNVKAKGKGALFKGVLTSISHHISADGKNPTAGTTLTFSYVQMSGFTLPGA